MNLSSSSILTAQLPLISVVGFFQSSHVQPVPYCHLRIFFCLFVAPLTPFYGLPHHSVVCGRSGQILSFDPDHLQSYFRIVQPHQFSFRTILPNQQHLKPAWYWLSENLEIICQTFKTLYRGKVEKTLNFTLKPSQPYGFWKGLKLNQTFQENLKIRVRDEHGGMLQ